MPRELPSLGELEIRVLRLVWQQQPCTERQISDLVQQERSVARTTVLKTMQRLEGKRLLTRLAGKGPVRYRATVKEQRVMPTLIRRFVDQTLGGAMGPLVAYLTDTDKLSSDDIEALRIIAKKIGAEAQDD